MARAAGLSLLLASSLILLQPSVSYGDAPQPPKRVLVLYHYGREAAGVALFEQGFENAFKSAPPGSIELYRETLEFYRFPDQSHEQLMHKYIKEKYAARKIDALVVYTDTSLEFLLRYRDEIFPGVPLVYLISKRPEHGTEPPLSTGIWGGPNIKDTLTVALKLQPTTEQVFVISGPANDNRMLEVETQEQLREFENRVRLNYLFDRPLEEILDTVRALPQNSIVLCQRQTRGFAGQSVIPRHAVSLIAQTANVPVYGTFDTWIGEGIVGGSVLSHENLGRRGAETVLKIINGAKPEDIPNATGENVPMFDGRQLQRWGISENNLPVGAIVLFEQQSFWELYRWRIVGVMAVMLIQAMLIVALLVQRSRSVKAEESRRLSQKALQKMTGQLISLRDEEHRRIAAELHDGLGQSLVIINNRALIGLRDAADSSRATEQFEEISSAASSAIDEVREIAYNLRPHELGKLGLVNAIESMVRRISDSSPISLSTDLDDVDGLLPIEAETSIYRIVQEALNNVVKHSGATEARVGIKRAEKQLSITVADNGRGIAKPSNGDRNGFGLIGIAERARMLGGSCVVDSAPDRGTVLTLAVSLTNGHVE